MVEEGLVKALDGNYSCQPVMIWESQGVFDIAHLLEGSRKYPSGFVKRFVQCSVE